LRRRLRRTIARRSRLAPEDRHRPKKGRAAAPLDLAGDLRRDFSACYVGLPDGEAPHARLPLGSSLSSADDSAYDSPLAPCRALRIARAAAKRAKNRVRHTLLLFFAGFTLRVLFLGR
jgi:hypothetical protein